MVVILIQLVQTLTVDYGLIMVMIVLHYLAGVMTVHYVKPKVHVLLAVVMLNMNVLMVHVYLQ